MYMYSLYLYTCSKEAKEGMPFVDGGVSRYSTRCSSAVHALIFCISHGV